MVVVQAQVVVQEVVDLGAKLLANDVARQTRVPTELPSGASAVLMGNFTGNNCDVNEITRARLSSAAGAPAGDW